MTDDLLDRADGFESHEVSVCRTETSPSRSRSNRRSSATTFDSKTPSPKAVHPGSNDPVTIHQAARVESPTVVPGPDDSLEESAFKVGIAEYALTVRNEYQMLRSSGFGSCIGVVLHDESAAITGLLHFMLPATEEIANSDPNPAKFGDSGIEAMLDSFREVGGSNSTTTAKLAGGAAMMDFGDDGDSIGKQNTVAARTALQDHDIPITAAETGGSVGRSVTVDAQTASVTIQRSDGSERVI
ncbi:chemotaxis protein CheD [Halostagnicola larsenii]|nr:chemotaxis protein CheD [Halostagnicola larsenii]